MESEGHHLALQLHPRPESSASPDAAEPQCNSLKHHCLGVPVNRPVRQLHTRTQAHSLLGDRTRDCRMVAVRRIYNLEVGEV